MNSGTTTICSTCGGAINPSRHQGRCPACVFAAAMRAAGEETLGEIGGHDLLAEIARGGMGVVYRARQHEPEREVALKTMRGASLDSPAALARFRNEADVMVSLDHPAILPVYQFGEEDGVPFFTMKLARGGTLAEKIGDYAGQWRRIAGLMIAVAQGVQHAHERGVQHRDLKPGNILFDEQGRPFVSDFGIAKLTTTAEQGVTLATSMLGTPHYMAPEVAAKDARAATIASDVWSLGVILYELLAQKRPFEAESLTGVLRVIAERDPDSLADVPRDLTVIAAKALSKEPARRYASAAEFADDLQRWLDGRPIFARAVSLRERAVLWVRRSPLLAASLLVAVMAVLGAIAALAWGLKRSSDDATRIRGAQVETQAQLREALKQRAYSGRLARQSGWKDSGLAALREATALRPDEDLRDEIIAHLAGYDLTQNDGPAVFSLPASFVSVDAGFTRMIAFSDRRIMRLHHLPGGDIEAEFPPFDKLGSGRSWTDPAGRWVVVSDDSGGTKFFDVKSRKLRADWPEFDFAGHSADGNYIAMVRAGEETRVVDTRTLQVAALPASGRPIQIAALAEDGAALAVVAPSGVEIFDWRSGRRLKSYREIGEIYSLGWRGVWLAVGEHDGHVQLYDVRTDRRAQLSGHNALVNRYVFTPDHQLLATTATDGTAVLWQTDSGQMLVRSPQVFPLAFSSDDRLLHGSKGEHGWGRVQRPTVMRFISDSIVGLGDHTLEHKKIDFSPDRRWLVESTSDAFAVIEISSGMLIALRPLRRGQDVCFTADGRHLIVNDSDSLKLMRIGTAGGRLDFTESIDLTPPNASRLRGSRLDPHREWLAVTDTGGAQWLMDCREMKTWQKLGSRITPTTIVPGPESRWLADTDAVQKDGLTVFPRDDRTKRVRLNKKAACQAVFSPDGRWLAESATSALRVHEVGTWKLGHEEKSGVGTSDQPPVCWSPDSLMMAFSPDFRRIVLLRSPGWRHVAELVSPIDQRITSLSFSPDGRTLAASRKSGGIELWDLTKLGRELARFGLTFDPPRVTETAPTPSELHGPVKEALIEPWPLSSK